MGYRPESVVFDFRADQTGLAVVGAKPAAYGLGKGQKIFSGFLSCDGIFA